MESPQVPAVCSHPHSIPRWDQVFFFQSLCGGIDLGGCQHGLTGDPEQGSLLQI